MTDLGTLGGAESIAAGVSRRGHVVGTSQRDDLVQHAFLWSDDEGMVDLGALTDRASRATDVNGRCRVVGRSDVTEVRDTQFGTRYEAHPSHAFLWSDDGGMSDIHGVGDWSEATAINERGDVVGNYRYFGEDDSDAFVRSDGGVQSVDFGPGTLAHYAEDVNDSRRVAMSTWDIVGGPERAVVWSEREGPRELGHLGGGDSSASGISNSGRVVGESQTDDGAHHAFLWSDDEGMRDLGTLGGGYSYADDVNERGQVVGWSRTGDGRPHAALWNPE